MEVAPFFVDFHDLRTFVAIYILSRFTHFFRKFFLAKIAISATSHVFCMYGRGAWHNGPKSLILAPQDIPDISGYQLGFGCQCVKAYNNENPVTNQKIL